ncbi:GNAT family N-acetyltransferase [Clostridiaceae bacterium 35-E11]
MKISLEKADFSHLSLVYVWANDPQTRKSSFNTEEISLEDHTKWYTEKMESSTCEILIMYTDEIPVGQIRAEYEVDHLLISYSIDKTYRGQGYGKLLLKLFEEYIMTEKDLKTTIVGKVKYDNIPSIKAFEANGYVRQEYEDHIVFAKSLK